ncbi:DUF3231 family protein [Anaerobacillus alkaliphilus]|uniref:DUF3231 family protein n=1 Tax=Anaerobacillus alkaliphilus TaxID=1548597 RepID=A0A4Q0VYM2_9BACI|nr:DUF3231 family protein [Anaerobacillus alkaliphilus]RXJ04276.1 DUF3231 family protein [Anaerobacillus alkaliphilus]
MPNYLESIMAAVKTIIDDEQQPTLNILEAGHCWLYYGVLREAVAFEQAGMNTTDDDELKGILKDAEKMCLAQAQELEDFMRKEGVPLPPVSEFKPMSNSSEIPPGVKLTDDEISNGVAMKMIALSNAASMAASQCVRTDLGTLWVKDLNEALAYGMTLKTKMRKRGWAKIPPSYSPPGV